jgi:hypothetical protein
MRYNTSRDFRQALETRIRNISLETETPLVRLRKLVVFERFLIRLIYIQPDNWVLKGGYALQLRLGDRARTTKDIDLLAKEQKNKIHPTLQAAGFLDLGDWFSFEVAPATESDIEEGPSVLRFSIRSLLDSRTFESFHIDVGVGDPIIGSIDYLDTPNLLSFANLEPVSIPCYPVNQQIAEKLHAYSRPRGSGPSSKVKDFIDIILLAELGEINNQELMAAIKATFDHASTHAIPSEINPPPKEWLRPYNSMAESLGLGEVSFDEAYIHLQNFLNPILSKDEANAIWLPLKWQWNLK